MTGKAFALTPRDRAVLAEVARFGAMTRDQIIRLTFFTSKTRANARLRLLTSAEYLVARPQPVLVGGPRFVYLPGPRLTDARGIRRRFAEMSDLFLDHQLGLVDIRIALERATTLHRWLTESDLGALPLGLIPDAYVEYGAGDLTFGAFVEYDRGTETLGRIERRVEAYTTLAFSGTFQRLFHRTYFRVFLVTDSERRLRSLSAAVATHTTKIFWLTTRGELTHHGPLASIWRRPGASALEPLTLR